MDDIFFRFKNRLSEIERAHEIVNRLGAEHHFDAEFVFELDLALEEIITNIIRYGYTDELEHEILVRFEFLPEGLLVEVQDDARPFNPLEAPAPDIDKPLEERRIGGLGIFLVRKMTDHLEYRREQSRNILTMTKRFSKAERPPLS